MRHSPTPCFVDILRGSIPGGVTYLEKVRYKEGMSLALFVLLQLAPQSEARWGSARPPECAKADGASGTNAWERAKSPELRAYCDKLASATSQLVGTGAVSPEVLTLAEEAAKARPEKAAPHVLRGRALARLGRHPEALAAFEEAKKRDERALEEPRALFTYAHGLARAGRHSEALPAYRSLLPRASQLDLHERAAAYVETGLLLLAQGPKDLDDALAVLRQARREAQESLQVLGVLALGLALERAGEPEQARALLAERGAKEPRKLEVALSDARVKEVLAAGPDPGEEHALRAVLYEDADPSRAAEGYRAYLEKSPKKPWEAHAKKRIEALSGKRAPAARPQPTGAPRR